jgi:hypothetical protein
MKISITGRRGLSAIGYGNLLVERRKVFYFCHADEVRIGRSHCCGEYVYRTSCLGLAMRFLSSEQGAARAISSGFFQRLTRFIESFDLMVVRKGANLRTGLNQSEFCHGTSDDKRLFSLLFDPTERTPRNRPSDCKETQ